MKTRIEKKIDKEEKEIKEILNEIYKLEEKVLEKRPSHFGKRDVVNAFFGALIVGITFLFKGLLFEVGLKIPWVNVISIVLAALIILTAQIYFIGYTRVKERKHERPFLQFWAKRIVAIYGIALLVSLILMYLYGIEKTVGHLNVLKLTLVISLPCAVGAAIPSLMKKY